jgi:ribosome-binding protein aMBF1 (putative translation factor)
LNIARAIKSYRLKQGLTQLDLAIKIDKSTRCIKRYEKGDTIPSVKVLSEIFNISIDEVIAKGLIGKGII